MRIPLFLALVWELVILCRGAQFLGLERLHELVGRSLPPEPLWYRVTELASGTLSLCICVAGSAQGRVSPSGQHSARRPAAMDCSPGPATLTAEATLPVAGTLLLPGTHLPGLPPPSPSWSPAQVGYAPLS